jgi:GT2 family glycosyltransferase
MSGAPLQKVSVAVLSWNGRGHLETCLEALSQQRDPGVEWEVLVLDNGSSDGTARWMEKRWGDDPRFRLFPSPVNLGFCAGNNRLVEEATGDAVALLNNDTRPEEGWLAALVDALRSAPADVAAVSGQIVDWEGARLDFGRGLMTFDGHAFQLDFRRPLEEARVPAAGEELPFACGGNLLIRRRSFLEAGGFDAGYFAYLEDVDLGWRLWSGGERVIFAPEAAVHHRSSATSDLLGHFNRGFLFERNAFLTAYKNYEAGLWEKVMPAILLTLTSRTQNLLIQNNPGAETLLVDPYAGWIANTAPKGASANGAKPADEPSGEPSAADGIPSASAPLTRAPLSPAHVAERFRTLGAREALRRAWDRLLGRPPGRSPGRGPAAAPHASPAPPQLTDERTVAQLRALTYLLGHLDQAATARAAVQARRRRSDHEIFERFPVYLVPTYPGDEALFAGEGFAAWYPKELPTVRASLRDIMEME